MRKKNVSSGQWGFAATNYFINLVFQAVCTTFAAVNIQRSIYGRLSGGKYDVIKPRFAISQLDGGVEC